MPVTPTVSDVRRSYYYRRPLSLAELLPAVGVGAAVGLAAFYVARILLERTALLPQVPTPPTPRGFRVPVRGRS